MRQVLHIATKKRIRSDVLVRIERIFPKWQMHLIIVPVRWASIAREIHAIPCHSRSVPRWRIDHYSTCRNREHSSEYPKTTRQLTFPNVLLSYSSVCIHNVHNAYVIQTNVIQYSAEHNPIYCYLVTTFGKNTLWTTPMK